MLDVRAWACCVRFDTIPGLFGVVVGLVTGNVRERWIGRRDRVRREKGKKEKERKREIKGERGRKVVWVLFGFKNPNLYPF